MSAPGITYSGVLAARSNNENKQRGVFNGLKFWLSVRVPNRKTYSETIQNNDGTIVLREGNADLLICDPAKDPLPGSYSYKLIDHAIEEGSLDTKDHYLCSEAALEPGQSRPAPKSKLTRNRFSEKDDQLLTKFVMEKERLGEPVNGNDIYMEFAEKHPNHTWQSWRSRWVKKLGIIPRPAVSSGQQSTRPVASSGDANTGTASVAKSKLRFTAEEDELLLETIHHAIENHEPWNAYQPYKELASEFPQRTYTSWRDRALNHVAKHNMDQINQWQLEADFHPADEEHAASNGTKHQQSQSEKDTKSASHQDSESMEAGDVNDLREIGPTQQNINNADSRPEHRGPTSSPLHTTGTSRLSTIPESGSSVTNKEQFYRDYDTFLESVGNVGRQIPSVGGKAISLWDLWQSARSSEVDADALDWKKIAEDLGFDWVSMESAPTELQQCYEEHLAPFVDAMMGFDDFEDECSTDEEAEREPAIPLPSSPPVPSLKRSSATIGPVHEQGLPSTTPKRRKMDLNHEVPSTPDHVNGTSHLRHANNIEKTPQTTPMGNRDTPILIPETESSRESEDESLGHEQSDHSIRPQGRKRRPEPETQDFNFVPGTPVFSDDEASGHSDDDSQLVATPSRQLRLESDAMSSKAQRRAPGLTVSRQKEARISPPVPRTTRVSFQQGDSGDDVRQKLKSAKSGGSTNKSQFQRRTLPPSYESKGADSNGLQDSRSVSPPAPNTRSRPKSSSVNETPNDIIDRFVSLGYTRDIVLCSLRATTWIVGNAGQVMEMLKRGEPLPSRTTGVWTQRDDDSLALVYSSKGPSDDKAEKKKAKEMKRLQAKHGAEQIALRKRYLLDELPE